LLNDNHNAALISLPIIFFMFFFEDILVIL